MALLTFAQRNYFQRALADSLESLMAQRADGLPVEIDRENVTPVGRELI